jgi:hypothetical protein
MLEGKSFLLGIAAGIMLRWSDIIPVFAGIVIGVSMKKVPDLLYTNELPQSIQNYIKQLRIMNKDNDEATLLEQLISEKKE